MELNKASPFKILLMVLGIATVVGCASYKNAVEGQKVAYRTAEKRETGLEVPPDLTSQSADEQFLIPGESNSGAVSASSFYSGGGARNASSNSSLKTEPVLVSSNDIKIKRVGTVRSLEVQLPAEQVWPKLREFWKSNGFELSVDDAKIGLMETNWAENRANIPLDGLRKILGTVFDGIYSSNTRDRYRTRLEPIEGGVEIFVTHRGMEENYTDQSQTTLTWVNRPSDPELEAEMLNRLLVKLTGNEKVLEASGEKPAGQALVSLQKTSEGTSIVLAEDFPLAWRRVGFGLDRAGFIVEDRDRSKGFYYVKYTPDSASNEGKKSGFFGKIFGRSKNDTLKVDQRFQVTVVPQGDKSTSVKFNSEQGAAIDAALSEEAANKLVSKLRD